MRLPFAALAAGLMVAASPALAQQVMRPILAPPNLPSPALPNIPATPSIIVPSVPPAPLPAPSTLPPSAIAPSHLPDPDAQQLAALYKQIADLYGGGKYQDAQPLAEEYVAKIDNLAGADSLAYASAISLLSRVHQAQGHFADAEPLLNRSIELLKEHQRGHERELATEIDALAQLYDAQGRFEEAEPLFVGALTLYEKIRQAMAGRSTILRGSMRSKAALPKPSRSQSKPSR